MGSNWISTQGAQSATWGREPLVMSTCASESNGFVSPVERSSGPQREEERRPPPPFSYYTALLFLAANPEPKCPRAGS